MLSFTYMASKAVYHQSSCLCYVNFANADEHINNVRKIISTKYVNFEGCSSNNYKSRKPYNEGQQFGVSTI